MRLALALGYEVRAVTPYLAVKGAAGAIDWYREIFGADEVSRWHDPAQAAKVTDPFGHAWLLPRVVA